MGAEESRTIHYNNERNEPYSGYANDDLLSASKSHNSKPLKSELHYGDSGEYRSFDTKRDRSRSRKKPIVDEKENRHRRHRSTDDWLEDSRRANDDSSYRKQITSDYGEKSKSKAHKQERKKDNKSTKERKNTESEKKKDAKEKRSSSKERKKKPSPEAKVKGSDKRRKSGDKPGKSKSCLPNVSEVRRRKKKFDLEKHKRSHRSVPDLSSDDTSRVGAWLNSNQFMWPPENQTMTPPYALSYGSLPRIPHPYSSLQQDPVSEPRPIVDGMGSPVGFIYPNGTFVPDGTEENFIADRNFKYPTAFGYSTPAFMQAPFPYFVPPHLPYDYYSFHNRNSTNPMNRRTKLMNRSRSQNCIDELGQESTQKRNSHHTASRIKQKSQRYASKSSLVSDNAFVGEHASSKRSPVQARTGEYYSDILETQNSLHDVMAYKANPQISVDDVKLAVFAKVKTPDTSRSESDFSDDSSSGDSSCNDIELGSSELAFPGRRAKARVAASQRSEPENVRIFQPASKREVFIDGSPEKVDVKSSAKARQTVLNSDVARKSPVMRLGEKQSIVATSFLVEGAKVFCLTKTTQTSPQLAMKDAEMKSKTGENSKLEISQPSQTQSLPNQPTTKKRDSGTWYGLTGSHTSSKSSFASGEEKPQLVGNRTSVPAPASKSSPKLHIAISPTDKNEVAAASKALIAGQLVSPKTFLKTESLTSPPAKCPTPKPRTSKVSPIPDISKSDDNVFEDFPINRLSPVSNDLKKSAFRRYSNDSSDSELLTRDVDGNHSLTRKLVRIDSRDSLTMKRRKIHRRSSSLTDKATSRNNSLDKWSTSTPSKSDFESSLKSLRSTSNSTENLPEPFMEALFHKAKSEEVLKHEITRSNEALLSDLAPPPQKETLQERAARILGLNSEHLYRAKEKEDADRSLLFGNLQDNRECLSDEQSSTKSVASNKSQEEGKSRINDTPTEAVPLRDLNEAEGQNSESFSISITESLLNKVQDKIEILNVDHEVASNSSGDVSTLSDDSTPESTLLLPVPDAEYLIEVSDSVLEETSVPCRVKPHEELSHPAAKEYQLPDHISPQHDAALLSAPTAAQVSIAASYADSIYDRVPTSTENFNVSELSDDATETDSLEQSARFQRLISNSSNSDSNEQDIRCLTASLQTDPRLPGSPVPVAPFSAPLTPDEVGIVMQLLNSNDEDGRTRDRVVESPGSSTHSNPGVDPKKAKVARAIGFNVANIGQGSASSRPARNSKLEKVENFEIKVFPTSSSNLLTSNNRTHDEILSDSDESTNDSADGVEGILQSLGMNREKSWLVEL